MMLPASSGVTVAVAVSCHRAADIRRIKRSRWTPCGHASRASLAGETIKRLSGRGTFRPRKEARAKIRTARSRPETPRPSSTRASMLHAALRCALELSPVAPTVFLSVRPLAPAKTHSPSRARPSPHRVHASCEVDCPTVHAL